MVRLQKFLQFANQSFESLSNVLGIAPAGNGRIPMEVGLAGGNPVYYARPLPHISIPWNVVEQQEGIQYLFVVFPHELAHYFLLTKFPRPPRWFIEGPASYFGNEVASALGYREAALYDRKKILGFAAQYQTNHSLYCFTRTWPEDSGRNDNPDDIHSCGFGYAYKTCLELEQLCGDDFFRRVFQHMEAEGVDFSAAKDEYRKNCLLIGAFQSQTTNDVWAYFSKAGFTK